MSETITYTVGPDCDSCDQPIQDGDVIWYRAITGIGAWQWHSRCPRPEMPEPSGDYVSIGPDDWTPGENYAER